MLHEDPAMLDIDVDHWRNLQSLILDSAKARRRIVVIHEDAEILKFVHSNREPIVRTVERVEDPHAVAERVYRDNADHVDFVAVLERHAFDEYFGRLQGTWRADEDLDAFVNRTYALLDEYREGIVTHPERARNVLGLQWRLGATYDQVTQAVERYVPPDSTVVFGVFDDDALCATLVLGFDADLRADVVTTVDPRRSPSTGVVRRSPRRSSPGSASGTGPARSPSSPAAPARARSSTPETSSPRCSRCGRTAT